MMSTKGSLSQLQTQKPKPSSWGPLSPVELPAAGHLEPLRGARLLRAGGRGAVESLPGSGDLGGGVPPLQARGSSQSFFVVVFLGGVLGAKKSDSRLGGKNPS